MNTTPTYPGKKTVLSEMQAGFTVIELLVTIGIIATLVMITLMSIQAS